MNSAGMYLIALILIILAVVFLNRGNTVAGGWCFAIGIVYLLSLRQYRKREKKKSIVRDAMLEADEERERKRR